MAWFHLSFTGVVTFKNAAMAEWHAFHCIACCWRPIVPIWRRFPIAAGAGRPMYSMWRKIAELGLSFDEIARATSENACALFGFNRPPSDIHGEAGETK